MTEEKRKKQRRSELTRALMNVKGEILSLKREQKKLESKLEDVLKSHAGLASMMYEEKKLLEDLLMGADLALESKGRELKKVA